MGKRNRRQQQGAPQLLEAVPAQQPEPEGVPIMPPRPVPTQITVTTYDQIEDGTKWVELILSTFTGMHVVFLPPDIADKVADNIKHHSTIAKTGLILPSTPDLSVAAEVPAEAKELVQP